jgi:hypothetical protein
MDMRRTGLFFIMVAGIVLALSAGCGGPSGQAGGGSVSTSSSGPSTGPSGPTDGPSGTTPPSPPRTGNATPPAAGEVIVRGRVEEGVEPGCTVLRADSGTVYLLVGADATIAAPGARVEVVGDPRIDMVTTCMQGTPLAVRRIRRI